MKLLRNKDVKINGKRTSKDDIVLPGDVIDVYVKDKPVAKENVVFDDVNILVVEKPKGILSETFFERLKEKYNELYFVHRLDRNTSGIMVFAKNTVSEKALLEGFKTHAFDKKYLAHVYGKMDKSEDVLTAYLLKDSVNSSVKIFKEKTDGSVMIKTGYKVVEEYSDSSLLEVTLYTGKTHQIRAHLSFIGHFIIGDGKYGDNRINKKFGAKTQKLTSYKITLNFDKKSPLYYLDKKTFSLR